VPRGLFITFEGPEGSGKTTQIELLGRALKDRRPVLVREPGGTQLGERLREVLLHSRLELDPEAEMLLFMAARRQLLAEVVLPALAEGRVVLVDRYHDSTLAYQGGGRGAPTYWPESFPRPDLTFLLELPAEAGLDRHSSAGKNADRLEAEAPEFHRRVTAEYDRLAAAEPHRFVRLNARLPAGELQAEVLDRVNELLKGATPRSS